MGRIDLVIAGTLAALVWALPACEGGPAPERPRAARPEGKKAAAEDSEAGDDGGEQVADEARKGKRKTGDESGEAGRLVILPPSWAPPDDKEFTSGLPEPSQDVVVAPPAPWAPPPESSGAQPPVIQDVWPRRVRVDGGDRVVIRGRNLRPALVLFGRTPAVIIGQSDDVLTVSAPAAQAGPATIVVTNRDGTYAMAAAALQYYR